MNEDLTPSAAANDELAPDIANFVRFLDDETPPLFIAASLTTLLRTDPPVRFGPARVAEIVAGWAADRTRHSGQRVSDLMLQAVRSIISAYGLNAIDHFKPKDFYRPFVAALLVQCPEEEREGLQAALRALQSGEPQRAMVISTAEFETGEDVLAKARANARSSAFTDVLERLAADPEMPGTTFDEEVASLRKVVLERGQVAVVLPIENLVELAIAVFNMDLLERAGRVFDVIADWLDHPATPAPKRLEIRKSHHSRELDERLLVAAASDPARAEYVRPAVRCFADLAPDTIVARLQSQKDQGRVRFLYSVLELHGPAAHSAILSHLQSPAPAGRGSEFVTTLLDITTRIGAPTDQMQRRATSVIGPLIAHREPQLREAALRAMAHVDPEGAMPHVLKALEASSYGKLSSADEEALRPHLEAALEFLSRSKSEATVAVVAEYATGARTGDFRLGRSLRDMAARALETNARPLPRRAALVVANALGEMAGRRLKLRFGSFGLGVDPEATAALLRLLEGSSEPEARQALANPTILKLAAR